MGRQRQWRVYTFGHKYYDHSDSELQLAQLLHLQCSPQGIPWLKHSQYFFWQPVFLQLHPFTEELLCPNGMAVFTSISSMARARTSLNSGVFWQQSQLQPVQKEPG